MARKKATHFLESLPVILNAARMAIAACEVGILSIDVDEIVTNGADLVQVFSTALCQDEVAGFASAGQSTVFRRPQRDCHHDSGSIRSKFCDR